MFEKLKKNKNKENEDYTWEDFFSNLYIALKSLNPLLNFYFAIKEELECQ